jgi:hypothetical protein
VGSILEIGQFFIRGIANPFLSILKVWRLADSDDVLAGKFDHAR